MILPTSKRSLAQLKRRSARTERFSDDDDEEEDFEDDNNIGASELQQQQGDLPDHNCQCHLDREQQDQQHGNLSTDNLLESGCELQEFNIPPPPPPRYHQPSHGASGRPILMHSYGSHSPNVSFYEPRQCQTDINEDTKLGPERVI